MEKFNLLLKLQSQIKTIILPGILTALIVFCPLITTAQSGSGSGSSGGGSRSGWGQKAQAREGSRWTLQEWMAQKQRNSLMDQWLIMNSPSPFEFSLLGASNSYQFQKDQLAKETHSSKSGAFSAYAQAIGLTAEYENNTDENLSEVTGLLNVRILGASLQSTSITLSIGQRTRQFIENSQKESVRNIVGQLSLQAYFTKYFGLSGSYRNFFPATNATVGEVSGTIVEGGLFIDFSGLRIFGNWCDELQTNQASSGTKTEYKRQGIKSGIVIFF